MLRTVIAGSFICAALCAFRVPSVLANPVDDWSAFEALVRDQSITRAEAEKRFLPLTEALKKYISENYFLSQGPWCFPVKGGTIKDLLKSDYRPGIVYGPYGTKGYDFFDGHRHGGHPEYDIFIRDRKEEWLDDRTGAPAEVLAVCDGVVVSAVNGRDPGIISRDGNYVWLYSPQDNRLIYYAHMKDICVSAGDPVKRGDVIGTAERSGILASKQTSTAYLRFMALEVKDGRPAPFNPYGLLSESVEVK